MGKKQKKNNKKKKTKVIYVDDGSTIADMSALSGKSTIGGGKSKTPRSKRSTFKEIFRTYTDAVRMMFLPMLAVLGIIALAYLILYFLL